MVTVDNLLLSTAKSLDIFDHFPNTQQLSPFPPKIVLALGKKMSYELPWRTALTALLRKYIADKSLPASSVHHIQPLLVFSHSLEAGCMDRKGFALIWAASVLASSSLTGRNLRRENPSQHACCEYSFIHSSMATLAVQENTMEVPQR